MDTIKLEHLLNGVCIVLIAITFVFVVITLAKAYRLAHEMDSYSCPSNQVIEGKYKVIENNPVKENSNVSPG